MTTIAIRGRTMIPVYRTHHLAVPQLVQRRLLKLSNPLTANRHLVGDFGPRQRAALTQSPALNHYLLLCEIQLAYLTEKALIERGLFGLITRFAIGPACNSIQ